jgi:L-cysteine/cystine lyase
MIALDRVSTSLDTEKLAMIRAQMPAVTRAVYLNTGTNGPLSKVAVDAITAYAQEELEIGRIGQARYDRWNAITNESRALLAELLGCETDEVTLTHNTTEGMNIALLGLDWRAGDELVTANSEHEGGLNPAAVLKARYGVNVIYTDIGLCNCDPLPSLERALSARTKAVVLSHVSWSTGAVLPMRELCEMAHSVGALVVCDAAQAAGMVPSRVYELGVDAYALSGQKWLCGPDGIGGLFIRRDLIPRVQNTFSGYYTLKTRVTRKDAEIQFGDTAMRYQYAFHYAPSLVGFNENLKWLRDEVGWEWAHRRIRELGQYAYEALGRVKGLRLYMPREELAGLVHFAMDDIEPADLTARLYEQNILIRHVPEPVLNRVATGFYNDEEDIERLARAIAEMVK